MLADSTIRDNMYVQRIDLASNRIPRTKVGGYELLGYWPMNKLASGAWPWQGSLVTCTSHLEETQENRVCLVASCLPQGQRTDWVGKLSGYCWTPTEILLGFFPLSSKGLSQGTRLDFFIYVQVIVCWWGIRFVTNVQHLYQTKNYVIGHIVCEDIFPVLLPSTGTHVIECPPFSTLRAEPLVFWNSDGYACYKINTPKNANQLSYSNYTGNSRNNVKTDYVRWENYFELCGGKTIVVVRLKTLPLATSAVAPVHIR